MKLGSKMAVNTKPTQFGTIYDPEMQQDIPVTYSYTPGNVGRMVYVGDPEMGEDVKYEWQPSKFDFSGAKYNINKFGQHEYTMPDGSKVAYNIDNDTVESYIPSNLGKARADVVHSYNGNLLGNPFTYLQPENLTFQGQKVQRGEDAADTFYLVNPNTYEYVKDAEGNYVLPYDYGSGNGFTNFMAENGWMLPLAMGAGAAAGAAGLIGGAAEAGAAGAGAAELAGPTYAELGYTGLAEGMAGPTYAELGYTGLNNAEAIAAADAASKGLTGAEALKYINQARQGLGLASALSKLAGGTGGGTGGSAGSLDLGKLANMLAPKNTYQGLELAQITPKNPFLFTTPGQTQATEGAYDVSGSNMANALRKKNYGIG